ncbi:exonuclease domain-containing protein [Klebsiella pneumoniae]|uniref:exonuclease domain-containing protein n=1 Tax=Klebsiella pneumoniae TaxID=573 RepID=UPI001D0D28E5|nr:exonuclease domain-containing protein [Klebsiella pneumoniae]
MFISLSPEKSQRHPELFNKKYGIKCLPTINQFFKMIMANWLNSDHVIIDTETTGLMASDEIIEITIINMRGEILLNTLVKPKPPYSARSYQN